MILFVSASFLIRLRLNWKPEMKAFLIGDRNLYFFTPEAVAETNDITAESIDAFLQKGTLSAKWQLLGFLSPGEVPSHPGYVQVQTGGTTDPAKWKATLVLIEDKGETRHEIKVKIGE